MKPIWVVPLLGAALLFATAAAARAQSGVMGNASNFSTVEYYQPPNDQLVRLRMSGAEARPQPGGRLLVKGLKLELFATNGRPEIVVTAPECIYDTLQGTASSTGPLQVRIGDGRYRIAGRGFLWRQSDDFLIISNQVWSVIESAPARRPSRRGTPGKKAAS